MGGPLRDAQAYFGERAQAYRESPSHGNADELARMVERLALRGGERALDVATGGGHTARALAAAGCEVVATDATRPMLRDLGFPGVLADAQRLPFADASFEVVACRIAAHHFPDLDAFVRESARVLAPGGRSYVFDLTSPEDPRQAEVIDRIERLRDPSHVRSHEPSRWRDAVAKAGLRLERLDVTASTFELDPWLARARMSPASEHEARALLERHRGRLSGHGLDEEGRMRVLRVELVATRAR